MINHATKRPGYAAAALLLLAAASFTACQTQAPRATSSTAEVSFDQAINIAVEGLLAQTQKLPDFLSRIESAVNKRSIVIDPMIDADSGQQTAATRRLERRIVDRIRQAYPQIAVVDFNPTEATRATYVLTGTIGRQAIARHLLTINLALTEIKTGLSAAQASAVARGNDVDMEPTPYYRDSPVFVRDGSVQGYVRTAATPPAQSADKEYMKRLANTAVISDATKAYDEERYPQALDGFKRANAQLDDRRLKALNGEYMSYVRLGRLAEAEEAFGKVVAYTIRSDVLQIRFLFVPGSTEFWADRERNVSFPLYPMWLRQIARQTAALNSCMEIIGHTSKTGSEAFNDRLSQQRALAVQQRLVAEARDLGGRTKPVGMGFRQTLIGIGTDDARDAPDRRVEFKVVPCG